MGSPDLSAYLAQALKQLERRRPTMPSDHSPTYKDVKSVLEEFRDKLDSLRALAFVGADLEGVAFILARARRAEQGVRDMQGKRDKLDSRSRVAKMRARRAPDPAAQLTKILMGPDLWEKKRLTEMIAASTRTRLRYNKDGRIVSGRFSDWATLLAHAELYQYFKRHHGRPHDAIIATVLQDFGLLQSNNPVKALRRQRNLARKKHPVPFLDPPHRRSHRFSHKKRHR